MNKVLCVTLSVTVTERSSTIFKVDLVIGYSSTRTLFISLEVVNHEKNLASSLRRRDFHHWHFAAGSVCHDQVRERSRSRRSKGCRSAVLRCLCTEGPGWRDGLLLG